MRPDPPTTSPKSKRRGEKLTGRRGVDVGVRSRSDSLAGLQTLDEGQAHLSTQMVVYGSKRWSDERGIITGKAGRSSCFSRRLEVEN